MKDILQVKRNPCYKAMIHNWAEGAGVVWGDFEGHPEFKDKFTHTARIVSITPLSNGDHELVTINSRYLLKEKAS